MRKANLALKLIRRSSFPLFVLILAALTLHFNRVYAQKDYIDLKDPKSKEIVLAKIGNTPITLGELVAFGKSSPAYYGFLQIPGGPDKLLKELVFERLLLLEGKDMKIPEPSGSNDALYLLRIKKELLPDLPPVTEKEAKEYYQKHLDEFSTPLLLRLSQIKVYFSENTRKAARSKIEKALEELKKGASFAEVAKRFSQEPISASRGGDIGFVPVSSLTPEEAKEQILKLKKGQISPILTIGNSFTIVKLTDRKEPIVDPFDKVKALVFDKAEQAKRKAQVEKLRQRLEKKWKVRYLENLS